MEDVGQIPLQPATPKGAIPLLPVDRRLRQGAWLWLGSLGMFFLSTLILYAVYVALRTPEQREAMREPLHIPVGFWWSTLALLVISGLLHWASQVAKVDQYRRLTWLTGAAFLFSIIFLVVQWPSMQQLLTQHQRSASPALSAFAMTYLLVLIHALHVLGGIIALAWVFVGSLLKWYDHERHYGVQFCAAYWHFLDVVWICMLVCFALASHWLVAGSP
jgi:cytochrome c oxidase subunit 3